MSHQTFQLQYAAKISQTTTPSQKEENAFRKSSRNEKASEKRVPANRPGLAENLLFLPNETSTC
eukprot:scaffold7799_cov94-Skeletonema_dohrnii-CCMP3373.AAC.5